MTIKILALCGAYVPAFEEGGPIRSLFNLAERLGGQFEFKVMTSAESLQAGDLVSTSTEEKWAQVGSAQVRYLKEEQRRFLPLCGEILGAEFDILYLNSFWPTELVLPALALKELGFLSDKSIVLAPRGQLSPGVMNSSLKKSIYVRLATGLGLYEGINWQATTETEKRQIRDIIGKHTPIHVAPNLGSLPDVVPGETWEIPRTEPGRLDVIFLSRIVSNKNLKFVIECLAQVEGEVTLDVYGPVEDERYWRECLQAADELPDTHEFKHHGVVEHDDVFETFGGHDLFFFPTKSENYGHVIHEALVSGCPVLLSDQTPWSGLEENQSGWSFPLNKRGKFVNAAQRCVDADEEEFRRWRTSAHEFGIEQAESGNRVERSRQLFARAVLNQ